jgi:hypothetical protein
MIINLFLYRVAGRDLVMEDVDSYSFGGLR